MNGYLANITYGEYFRLTLNKTYLINNWIHFIFPILAGYFIYQCKKWSLLSYLLCMIVLFMNSYMNYVTRSGTMSLTSLIVIYIFNILVVVYFMVPSVRTIYWDPKVRWWESSPRYKTSTVVRFKFKDKIYEAIMDNFSISGVFILSDFIPGHDEFVSLNFEYDGVVYEFNGQVVNHSNARLNGFGVKIKHTFQTKMQAKKLGRSLNYKGLLLSSRLPSPEEGFRFWFKELVSSGRGLFPKVKK